MQFIQAPDSLKALVGVSQVYLKLIALEGFDEFPYDKARKFKELAEKLVDSDKEIQHVLPKVAANREQKATTALHGEMSHHPAYTLFYYENNVNPIALRRFQQAMLTGINLPKEHYRFKPSDFSNFGLAIRELTDVHEGQEWLKEIEQSELSSLQKVRIVVELLIDRLNLVGSEHKSESKRLERLIKQLTCSHLFLDVASGYSVIRRKGGRAAAAKIRESLGIRGISSINPGEYCELKVLGDLDDDSEHPAIYSIVKTPKKKKILDELEDMGVDPKEIEDPYEFIFVRYQDVPAYAQAFNDALRARGAAKRMELQNQFLPMSTQMLNDQDLIIFSQSLKKWSIERQNKKISLLLRCLFVTSSNINRVIKLQIIIEGRDFYSSEESLGYDLDSREWLIPVFSLDLKTNFNKKAQEQCRYCHENYFRLPDMFKFHEHLKQIFDNSVPEYPFKDISKKEKYIRQLLSDTGSRLTLSRLERYLTLFVAGKYEATQSTYLFSNYLSTSSARRFYTSLSVNYYRKLYKKACNELAAIVRPGFSLPMVNENENKTYIGARYSPKIEHVETVLKEIALKLETAKKIIGDSQNAWIEYHNLFTVFSIYGQGFLTGIRSVENPFVGPEAILEDQNCVVFRDKDSDDQFHTRIAPLHPLTKNFSDNYQKHRNTILTRLAAINPLAVMELTKKERQYSDFVFFLTTDGHWHSVRPKMLKQRLNNLTELPINSNRKLIRNFLLENKVSVHAIDTILGHASRGEPFWGTCSTRSFRDLSDEINKALTKLSNSIGLKAIEGLSV